MLDTTRIRQIGVGQHRRKNDAIDAEAIALAVESGRVAEAHVLSPERRALRGQLSVRGALVQTRSQYVTTIRGLARAAGILLPKSATGSFVEKVTSATMGEDLRALIAPLVRTLEVLDAEIAQVEVRLAAMAEQDPTIALCATAPGVGLIVAATYVSVIDDAKRFRKRARGRGLLGPGPRRSHNGRPVEATLGWDYQTRQHVRAHVAGPIGVVDLALANEHGPYKALGRSHRANARQEDCRRRSRAQALGRLVGHAPRWDVL